MNQRKKNTPIVQNDIRFDWPLVLSYHSISDRRQDGLAVKVSDFDAQMAWLQHKGYRSVTLADFFKYEFKRGELIVIITFDDGYMDNYTMALPVLKRYGFVGTIFLVTDYVNTDLLYYWDVSKLTSRDNVSLYQVLTWDQVFEMADYGFEFGSHTCSHPELDTISPAQYEEEIIRSRQDLQVKLEREVGSFCYPRGNLNTEIIQTVEKAGYECAVVTAKMAGIPVGRYTIPRVGIYNNITPLRFRMKVTPFIRRIYEGIRWPSWTD